MIICPRFEEQPNLNQQVTESSKTYSSPCLINFIKPNFVISRDKYQNPVSYYSSDEWDLSSYSHKSVKLNFLTIFNVKNRKQLNKVQVKIIEEWKQITWLMMFEPTHSHGGIIKANTFNYYHSTMRGLALIASNLNISLSDLSHSPKAYNMIMTSAHLYTYRNLGILRNIAANVRYFNNTLELALPLLIPNDRISELSRNINVLRKNSPEGKFGKRRRTPLIPVRIYTQLLKDFHKTINDFASVSDSFCKLIERYYSDPYYWYKYNNTEQFRERYSRIHAICKKNVPAPDKSLFIYAEDAINQHGLSDYFKKKHLKDRGNFSWTCVIGHITHLQVTARYLIYAYTGMRAHENQAISYDCIDYLNIPDLKCIPIIVTRTSKMTNNNYSENELPWVTCEEVLPAIDTARQLAKTISRCRNWNAPMDKNFPLFPSLNIKGNNYVFNYPVLTSERKTINDLSRYEDGIAPYVVLEEDMKELESFDAFRDWRNNSKVKVGKPWPLSPHQFRRATAVYSARSGKVKLPDLRFQFKHLSVNMTMLYRENASFAQALIDESDGGQQKFINDYINEVRLLEALEFIDHIGNADSKLTGGSGAKYEQQKNNGINWFYNQEEVKRKMDNGEISYRKTPIGGCTKRQYCEALNLFDVTPCLQGCDSSVIGGDNGSKLKQYREELEFELSFIEPKSNPAIEVQKELDLIDIQLKKHRKLPHEK